MAILKLFLTQKIWQRMCNFQDLTTEKSKSALTVERKLKRLAMEYFHLKKSNRASLNGKTRSLRKQCKSQCLTFFSCATYLGQESPQVSISDNRRYKKPASYLESTFRLYSSRDCSPHRCASRKAARILSNGGGLVRK
jgi:hypothetical protein